MLFHRGIIMRLMIALSIIVASAANSWILSAQCAGGSLSDLVGAVNCKDDCKNNAGKPVNECLHSGAADPCSPITCIQNVGTTPRCTKLDSGGGACKTKSGNAGTQTNFDQPCSSKAGWELYVFQAKSDCAPLVQANIRCKTDTCGSGTGYAAVPRTFPVCN